MRRIELPIVDWRLPTGKGCFMNDVELKLRTKKFALRVMKLVEALPAGVVGKAIGMQLIRSATSVGANYRAACRGRSKAEFIAKLQIVVEEADECCYWLELVIEASLLPESKVAPLLDEANQLTAFMVASRKSAQGRIADCRLEIADWKLCSL